MARLLLLLVLTQVVEISSYFKGIDGDADVFENPTCEGTTLSKNACECSTFNAECVTSGCQICKCRKKTRIYRSDVRKCLTDIEARDPWCRYQFVKTRADVIPTIDLSKKCPQTKCSKPINAPFDKTKHSCSFGWVNYLENGTWHEESLRKFQNIFHLKSWDYFSDRGYSYSLEWKGSRLSHIRKRLFQVSLECLDRDNMKESYCLMFQVRGKNSPILLSGSDITQKTTQGQTTRTHAITSFDQWPVRTRRPTRFRDIRRKEDSSKAKIVVVSDNFTVILAAIAGALGTALIMIPIALLCRRSSRRRGSMRPRIANSDQPSTSFSEEPIELEPQTSEETLSSYTSLTKDREPPPLYQPLRKRYDSVTTDEEPIYISVSGGEEEKDPPKVPPKPPPIYHVLEDLRKSLPQDDEQDTSDNDEC